MGITGLKLVVVAALGVVGAAVVDECPTVGCGNVKVDAGRLLGAGNVHADKLGITRLTGIMTGGFEIGGSNDTVGSEALGK